MSSTKQTHHCDHCGTPFQPKETERFCCHGCEYVYQLLHAEGFTRYYALKGSQTTPPVGARVFRTVDAAWLEQAIKNAEAQINSGVAEATFGIRGLSCLACVWLIEAIFKAQPGAISININARTGVVQPRWQAGKFDGVQFMREVQKLGYELIAQPDAPSERAGSQDLAMRAGMCAFFLLNTMLFTLPGYLGMNQDFYLAPLFNILGALFATLSLAFGGSYFFKRASQALRHKVLSIDFPIALGLVAAYAGSLLGWLVGAASLVYFDFVATFVFLMLVGRWVQEYALEKNRQQVTRRHYENHYVTLFGGSQDGARAPIEQIKAGDTFAIAPGEINPVSATPHSDATFSLEWINGEPDPVAWQCRRVAPAGAINVGLTNILLTAEESWERSLLSKLMAPPPDKRYERRLQHVLTAYIGVVLAISIIGGLAWLASGAGSIPALQVFISILIVSCPCALGVALPLTDELCIAKLRRQGLFIKASDIWERLRAVKTVVFDKTGTLTLDTPQLLNSKIIEELSAIAALALHQMTCRNLHPIARTLRENLLLHYPTLQNIRQFNDIVEVVGQGVYFKNETGVRWSLGKAGWRPGEDPEYRSNSATAELRCNGKLIAVFHFAEDVRDSAQQTVDALQLAGCNVAILSGDAEDNVKRIAKQLGITVARAQCSPNDKAQWIKSFAPQTALMIGDGANDRLAFIEAVCRGAPIDDRSLLESSADFFFFGRSLASLPQLLRIAKQRQRAVIAIFALAIAYNIAAVTLCLMGAMHPLLAAILMPVSSVVTLAAPWHFLRD